ncbi:hypothetical protein A0H81_04143 [Grifola frondosa]|uniref:Uncharacterized protein n=1 Tax=Grifola frondosa TaxID=5627 RepID=A0A1C7MH52_GRIFR|nr:hypothetical protein A0H81_04143 [Grifola frondosa]
MLGRVSGLQERRRGHERRLGGRGRLQEAARQRAGSADASSSPYINTTPPPPSLFHLSHPRFPCPQPPSVPPHRYVQLTRLTSVMPAKKRCQLQTEPEMQLCRPASSWTMPTLPARVLRSTPHAGTPRLPESRVLPTAGFREE